MAKCLKTSTACALLLITVFVGAAAWLAFAAPSLDARAASGGDLGPGLSRRAAAEFDNKLTELAGPAKPSPTPLQPVVVTDSEVNSYLKYDRPPFLPPAVQDVVIHLKPEGIRGEANINFDMLQEAQSPSSDLGSRLVASIFRGTQHLTALGKITSRDGSGTLTIQDVHIGSVALSDWLVNWLIHTYVESQYKVDLSKPFLLPGQVTRIDFASGKAIFVRGQNLPRH